MLSLTLIMQNDVEQQLMCCLNMCTPRKRRAATTHSSLKRCTSREVIAKKPSGSSRISCPPEKRLLDDCIRGSTHNPNPCLMSCSLRSISIRHVVVTLVISKANQAETIRSRIFWIWASYMI